MASTVWRGMIAFGLVTIPVKLEKAARRERIRFNDVYRAAAESSNSDVDEPEDAADPAPASARGQAAVNRDTSAGEREAKEEVASAPVERVRTVRTGADGPAPLARSEILKGFEVEKGRYAVLQREDIAAIRPRTSAAIDLIEFVPLQEIDPIFFDASFYARPDRNGEKPYALLYTALRESGYGGLGLLAMHGRDHSVLIRAGVRGLIVHTLFYPNEVRGSEEFALDPQLTTPKESEMALALVCLMAAKFDPAKLKSTYEERLRDLVASRRPVELSSNEAAVQPTAPAIDIMEALKASLERARKPAALETMVGKSQTKTAQRRKARPA
jgi:DNA end-binding protein Ku